MLNRRILVLILISIFSGGIAAGGGDPADDDDDCELNAPNTMHEFCCDIHDSSAEFSECEIEWTNKIHTTNDEEEMNYNFCLSECIYNKTGYLGKSRKSLRMKLIRRHLEELHGDEESETLMMKTYEMCAKHAMDMLGHEKVKELGKRLKKYDCHPYPGLVFECVSNEIILECPKDKYHDTASCSVARSYLKQCAKHRTS